MDAKVDEYQSTPGYKEDKKDPLVDISLTDSTELWLIQWPLNHLRADDLEGKELSLMLHHDGTLGSFETASGKSYDIVSFGAQEPDATVFLASSSKSKVVGKVSRRVCFAHYPEIETKKRYTLNQSSRSQGISGSLRTESSSQFSTPLTRRSNVSASLTQSSQEKSAVITMTASESSKCSRRKSVDGPSVSMRSVDHSAQDSGREGLSSVSSLAYYEGNDSHQGKSKKKKV